MPLEVVVVPLQSAQQRCLCQRYLPEPQLKANILGWDLWHVSHAGFALRYLGILLGCQSPCHFLIKILDQEVYHSNDAIAGL